MHARFAHPYLHLTLIFFPSLSFSTTSIMAPAPFSPSPSAHPPCAQVTDGRSARMRRAEAPVETPAETARNASARVQSATSTTPLRMGSGF